MAKINFRIIKVISNEYTAKTKRDKPITIALGSNSFWGLEKDTTGKEQLKDVREDVILILVNQYKCVTDL